METILMFRRHYLCQRDVVTALRLDACADRGTPGQVVSPISNAIRDERPLPYCC